MEKAKDIIIVILSIFLVGAVGYILGRSSLDQPPVAERNYGTIAYISDKTSLDHPPTIERDTGGLRERQVPQKNTISHKVFDKPVLAWVTGNRAQVAVVGVALHKVNERRNELLFLFKIQVKDGGFCIDSTKRVIRRIVNDEGVSAAATDSSKTCGDRYTTLDDQWLAFEVDPDLREFAFVLPPTSVMQGATPTGSMYVSLLDTDELAVRLELDATPKTRDPLMPDDPI